MEREAARRRHPETARPRTETPPVARPGNRALGTMLQRAVLQRETDAERLGAFRDASGKLTADPAGMPLGPDGGGTPITAYKFPGIIPDVALVVAGVHGSEQSGVEVAEILLDRLRQKTPYYTVVVVPRLFASNVAARRKWEDEQAAGPAIDLAEYRRRRNGAGDPGRVTPGHTDPNRQFPKRGDDPAADDPRDAKGRAIEPANLALMALIDQVKPSRVVSIHAVKALDRAGIYSDPHPSTGATPLAAEADDLAVRMARRAAAEKGGRVPGNRQGGTWTSLYPGQNPHLSPEQIRREDDKGVSFGQWGPSRGMAVITIEVGEQYRSNGAVHDPGRLDELSADATAVLEVFLGPPPPAPAAPVQRMIAVRVAEHAGNRAAARYIGGLRRPT